MFLAKISILLKPSILDPQGQAASQALQRLGHHETRDIRVGRYIELKLEAKEQREAQIKVAQYCETLLANPIIEEYHFELEPVSERI